MRTGEKAVLAGAALVIACGLWQRHGKVVKPAAVVSTGTVVLGVAEQAPPQLHPYDGHFAPGRPGFSKTYGEGISILSTLAGVIPGA